MITVTPEQIQELTALRGWSHADACTEIARACFVHPRSVERWIKNGCKRSAAAKRILAMLEQARRKEGAA